MKDKIRLVVMKVFNQEADVDTVVNSIMLLIDDDNKPVIKKHIVHKIIGKNEYGVLAIDVTNTDVCELCKNKPICGDILCDDSPYTYFISEEEEQKLDLTIIPDYIPNIHY